MIKKIVWGIFIFIGAILLLFLKPFTFLYAKIQLYFFSKGLKRKYNHVIDLFEEQKYNESLSEAKILAERIKNFWGENNEYYFHIIKTIKDIYFESEDFEQTISASESILVFIENFSLDEDEKIDVFYKLAYSNHKIKKFFLALQYYKKLFALKNFSELNQNYFEAKSNLTQIYIDFNQLDTAEKICSETMDYSIKNNLKKDKIYLAALISLIEIKTRQKNFVTSLAFGTEAFEIGKEFYRNTDLFGNVLYVVASAYYASGDLEKAATFANLGIENSSNNSDDYKSFKALLGGIKNKSNPEESIKVYEEIFPKEIPNKIDTLDSVIEQFMIAENYRNLHDIKKAKYCYSNYMKGVLSFIKDMMPMLGEMERLRFVESWWGAQGSLLSFAVTVFDKEPDFIKQIFNYRALTKELLVTNFEDYEISQDTFENILKGMCDNSAIIEIIRFKDCQSNQIKYLFLIINSDNKNYPLYAVFEGDDLEQISYKNYTQAIMNKSLDFMSANKFWNFLEPFVKGKDNIFISPDGVFRFINFNSLLLNDGNYLITNKNIKLFNNYKSILKDSSISEHKSNEAVFIGAPAYFAHEEDLTNYNYMRMNHALRGLNNIAISELPETEFEVIECEEILKNRNWITNTFIHSEATKENFLNVQSPRVFHIATHGFDILYHKEDFDAYKILSQCGLLLSNCAVVAPEMNKINLEGLITGYEIQEMNLNATEIVILSACSTGLGFTIDTGDIFGLQRAFFKAGAKSIIMSLWGVDDEVTRVLMAAFYSSWVDGSDKFEAFRKAQLEVMKKYAHPFYWAGFILLSR